MVCCLDPKNVRRYNFLCKIILEENVQKFEKSHSTHKASPLDLTDETGNQQQDCSYNIRCLHIK